MFNSALIYELAVAQTLCGGKAVCDRKRRAGIHWAKRLLKFLDYFVGIGSENVPTNSLLREFIGGGCFKI